MDMEFVAQEYSAARFYLGGRFEIGKPGPGGFMVRGDLKKPWAPSKQQALCATRRRSPTVGGMLATDGWARVPRNTEAVQRRLDQRGRLLWKF